MSKMERMAEHEEEATGGEGVNAITVLGRELLLVDVGGGAETHLAEAAGDGQARPAVDAERFDVGSPWFIETEAHYDEAALVAPRWEATTLCGRTWHEMAPGEGGTLYLWQEASFAPTCRSCLRVVDTWFPRTDAPAGVELLAAVIAEGVEEFGSVQVTSVPAEHVEAVRRAARRQLRAKGFRSTTLFVGDVVHVLSNDAHDAIDPEVKQAWIDEALSGFMLGVARGEAPRNRSRGVIDWCTWVVDG